MVIKLIALKPMAYAGARLKRGDAFEAKHEKDAKLLRAVKLADFPPPAPIMLKKPAVVDVVVTPVAEPTVYEDEQDLMVETPAPAPKPKRTYKRKDMVAE
jgi:hypothetical protein